MAFDIINPLYPKPHVSAGGNSVASGFSLTVGSAAASSFLTTSFEATCPLVSFDVQTNPVYVTFDGTTPAVGTSGHYLATGTNYTWSTAAAKAAKFLASGGSANIYVSQWSV